LANDSATLVGTWTVNLREWTWEYTFAPGGLVTWRDTRGPENGVGRWSLSAIQLNIAWNDSPTRESWFPLPLTPPKQGGWYDSTYYKGAYEARKIFAPPANPPTIGARGDWFVTGFSGSTVSVVVLVGFTTIAGSIELSNANGDKITKSIGLYGPSIGLSYTPNIGKMAAKLPGVQQLMTKFPMLAKIITGSEEKFAERVLLYLWSESPRMRAAVIAFPPLRAALDMLIQNRNAGSYAAESWWAKAIGIVIGKGSTPLQEGDFVGQCVCYAITLAAGPGNAGTYVLFFGLPDSWDPKSEPSAFIDLMKIDAKSKGVAIISSASVALGLPSLSAGATVFWGEIT
jgi:hypothetical protein